MTPKQNLNLAKIEKNDLKLVKNEIAVLNLSTNKNSFASTYKFSINEIVEVATKQKNSDSIPLDIKTKKLSGGNSIFVEAFQTMRAFPTRQNVNCYDSCENQFVKRLVMLKAHLICIKQIDKRDKTVKFDKK